MKNGKRYLGDPHKAKKKWLKKKEKEDSKSGKIKDAKIFWDKEYAGEGKNFSLSEEASEDLQKFCRFLEREYKGQQPINKNTKFVDAGCGNGRNSFFLAENFGAKGIAYDISPEAIKQANLKLQKLNHNNPSSIDISFSVQNLNEGIPEEDGVVDLVIDAVASHVLNFNERHFFRNEVVRVLSSGSYYFLKSLLLDDDSHAKQMIKEFGANAGEPNSYIHPTIGIFEHVPTEEELVKFYEDDFYIDKIERSFAHRVNGRANKRRYIVMYLRKK
jgi:SAM-dependent methyltransferase